MANFITAQDQLAQSRRNQAAAVVAAAQAAQQKKQLQSERDRFARTFNPDDRTAAAENARLSGLANQAEQNLSVRQGDLQRASDAVGTARAGFETFTDPRVNVAQLPDRSPFLLLPVRLETRFVKVGKDPVGIAVERTQLLVRIYPDDCSIDTFESVLSTIELGNAQRYWRGIWRAGGIEADERAAWRGLVAAHGSGRARWIIDHYQPVNLAQKLVKAAASDEILVIATQTPLSTAEAAATSAYWQAIWLADNDLTKQQAARAVLNAAVGAARAADIIGNYRPYNLADAPTAPTKKGAVVLSTAFVVWPPDPPTQQDSWTQAPRVNHLADRFVVIGYLGGRQVMEAIGGVVTLPLIVGPDPSAPPSDQIHPEKNANGDLFVPDELQWMVDFDRAVAAGMGLRIDLTPEQARTGFDRLLVLGLQLSASDADGKAALEDLLTHHHFGHSGLSLLLQGAPTHNTTGTGSGFTSSDDADASFDDRKQPSLITTTTDPFHKSDGQWLSELLGVDPIIFAQVHHTNGADQMQARAMQRTLWPATLGYWMDKMLTPVFDDDAIENTRWFFTNYVSGRGPVPAVRIGQQPYGILPTTAFSRIRWLDEQPREVRGLGDPRRSYLAQLLAILRAINADWEAMSAQVAYVGKPVNNPGAAHQILLDLLGLHPASVEFHSRYAESLSELFNAVNLWGFGPNFWQAILALSLQAAGMSLLGRLGYSGTTEPDILQHIFVKDAQALKNVIDDRPLSESNPIRAYTDDNRNYIRWLIDAAKVSLDALTQEQGFSQNTTPETILYLFLRHALMLGYYDSSYNLHRRAGFLTTTELYAMKPEPAFVHVADGTASESRFAPLYKTEPRITTSPTQSVAEYITANIGLFAETQHLFEQLDGLDVLKDASTASLERAFAEHIDCCSYRFDAWLLGLVDFQLQAMRYAQDDKRTTRTGIYLGAYAWLEDLRPSAAQLVPAQLSPDLSKTFAGSTLLMSDPTNGGYIHAPSLPHAATAAVLRSGYLANASQANPETMAINLSSDRVRLALSTLEGIRNGQKLGALLGYRFERGLHDDHGLAEVDKFIYPLRKQFPLVADQLSTTKTDSGVPIEAIEARNVMDGLKLITHIRTSGASVYPFSLPLPGTTNAEAAAIAAEVDGMLNVYDAIADLALAEGVHQAVQGNFDRVAATLDTYTTGNYPPEPVVVQTPPSGIGLTHRVALHLEADLGPLANATPRATVEPALNSWLASVLPPPDNIACNVKWTDPVSAAAQERAVTMADLGLQPLDLIELVKPDDNQAMTELDDRILGFVVANAAPRPDSALGILYMSAPAGKLSVFEVAPLVRSLRTLIIKGRPLRATDAVLHNDATPEKNASVFVDRARIANPKTDLDTLSADFTNYLAILDPLVADPVTNRAAIIGGIDGFLDGAVRLLDRAARFNMPLSGWGFAFAWKQTQFTAVMKSLSDLIARLNAKLADYDARIAAYDMLPAATTDDDRFKALRAAEILVTTKLDPLPATPALLRGALDVKRASFVARRDQFSAVHATADPSYPNLLASVRALLPIADIDAQTFDLTPFENPALIAAADLATTCRGHFTETDKRRAAAQAQLAAHDAATTADGQVQALETAAKAILGDDFRIIPEFSIDAAHGDEWANALDASTSGTLLKYLTTTVKIDFPVDEWLYGTARVRPNLHAWEQLVVLAGAFGIPEPSLIPMQLPFDANASWLAMQYPPNPVLDSDRLLYTACYAKPFDKTKRQCGLMLDEWTEVIPAVNQTTGITFNFDRPNNEAPQTMLLVTPATANGAWQWDDLVGALNETLDLAKKRAVEPVHIDSGVYSRFLPATIMASTLYGISITTTLAASNGVFRQMEM